MKKIIYKGCLITRNDYSYYQVAYQIDGKKTTSPSALNSLKACHNVIDTLVNKNIVDEIKDRPKNDSPVIYLPTGDIYENPLQAAKIIGCHISTVYVHISPVFNKNYKRKFKYA